MCEKPSKRLQSGTEARVDMRGIPNTQRNTGLMLLCGHTPVTTVGRNSNRGRRDIPAITSATRIVGLPLGEGGYAMKVKSITYAGKADVFNMEVEDTHDFVIQGGVISHNCADEWRYMCMARPIEPIREVEQKTILSDPLNMFTKKR